MILTLPHLAEERRRARFGTISRRHSRTSLERCWTLQAAACGETLRRSVQEIEGAEFKVIETTPAKGKNAA
jgi:hypothetical protein